MDLVCIHSASLCFLVGAFISFTFKVIIYIYFPIVIFFIGVCFSRSFSSFVFSYQVRPFNSCKAGFVAPDSLNCHLSVKLLISPSILNEILARESNLACRFFPFSTSNISCHSLLACRVSAERSAVKLIRFPLYVTLLILPCCF